MVENIICPDRNIRQIMQFHEFLIGASLGTYFGLLIVLVFYLLKKVRIHFYREKISWFENNLHRFYGVRQLLLMFFPLIFSLTFLGLSHSWEQIQLILSEHLLSLIVLGLSINVFWIIQLPLIMKANVIVDFSVDSLNNFKENEILLNSNSRHIVYTRIYNTGYSTLKNATVLIYFERGVTIVPCDESIYGQFDFTKDFSIQNRHCGVAFNCLKNCMTIPPQEWFLFPVILNTKNELEEQINVQLYSENSWGIAKHFAKMMIK